ncbi:hypothetical protein DF132_09875 [Burkholderia cenocepacia]|nr:hypothetical protein DF132_09875 [Burkholderia cenocepacia]
MRPHRCAAAFRSRHRPACPYCASIPDFSPPYRAPRRDFFLSGGVTRTSSSARISPDPPRSVPSPSELRRTPAQQGCAAFVTASATRGGTR